MYRPFTLALVAAAALPSAVHAEVGITEVAWMGTNDNANAEWIELHNAGSDPVSLSGWRLTSSTGAPTITLTGTVAADGYYLLTRTSTSIIPGVTGDQAYTGALPNTGATLTLADASGAVMDTVAGGANWASIGGDNATKETPQLTDSGTWITAAPTPGAATLAADESVASSTDTDEGNASTTPSASIGGSVASRAVPALPALSIVAGSDRIVATHADTPYEALVYEGDAQMVGFPISWAFGDGAGETGPLVHHAYAFPGTYLAVVRATVPGRSSIIKTLQVVVEDSALGLEVHPEGITVINESSGVLDLSGWRLAAGGKTFVIPSDTAILPAGRVVFAPDVTGLSGAMSTTTLQYPNGSEARTAVPPEPEAIPEAPAPVRAHTEYIPHAPAEPAVVPPPAAPMSVYVPKPRPVNPLAEFLRSFIP